MADKPVAEVVNVDAVIDALSPSPTSSDVYEATLPFNPHAVAASAVRRAGEGGGGGGDSVLTATVKDVTAAQMKALATTGVELVAAPGAGKAIVPLGLFVEMKFNSVAYTDPGGTADIEIVNTSNPAAPSVTYWAFLNSSGNPPSPGLALFTNTSSSYWVTCAPLLATPFTEGVPPFANTAVGLVNYGANLADGNSPVRFTVYYATVTLLA